MALFTATIIETKDAASLYAGSTMEFVLTSPT